MSTDIVYLATRNSDQTEGRGHPLVIGIYTSEDDAVAAVQGQGVMGVGPGDVYSCHLNTQVKYLFSGDNRVYGYREDWAGRWGYGYVDNRDAPSNDPEYEEYLRLKEKFGVVDN